MDATKKKYVNRLRRHRRVRSSVKGTADRPRLSVFRSNRYIYCQVIDDDRGVTLATASSLASSESKSRKGNVADAEVVGSLIASACKEKGISKVCFDRGGSRYHGRVKALADAARKNGLVF